MRPILTPILTLDNISPTIITISGVPYRPTVTIFLIYQAEKNYVICATREKADNQLHQTIAFDGNNFLFGMKTGGDWKTWEDIKHTKFSLSNEIEAFCYITLLMSDVFCASQARSDFSQAIRSPFWVEVMNEMQTLHTVASVMVQ